MLVSAQSTAALDFAKPTNPAVRRIAGDAEGGVQCALNQVARSLLAMAVTARNAALTVMAHRAIHAALSLVKDPPHS